MSRLLTLARDLQRRKARERQRLFVAEGIRTVEELLASPVAVTGALTTEQLLATPRGRALRAALEQRGTEIVELSERNFATASDTDSPQGIIAIAEIPRRELSSLAVADRCTLLVLDGVQDPGNVGTILRTAAGLGANATIALPGTVDLWNAKVVRSAMGAHFQHPAVHTTWPQLDSFLGERGVVLWGADAHGASLHASDRPGRLAIAVGNEGAGLDAPVRARADRLVSLPLASGVESLNVAVAAGIFLYELIA
jgi:RNA methyltransferase, TrmH family